MVLGFRSHSSEVTESRVRQILHGEERKHVGGKQSCSRHRSLSGRDSVSAPYRASQSPGNSARSKVEQFLFSIPQSTLHALLLKAAQAWSSLLLWIQQFSSSPADREDEMRAAEGDNSVRELLHGLLELCVRLNIKPSLQRFSSQQIKTRVAGCRGFSHRRLNRCNMGLCLWSIWGGGREERNSSQVPVSLPLVAQKEP